MSTEQLTLRSLEERIEALERRASTPEGPKIGQYGFGYDGDRIQLSAFGRLEEIDTDCIPYKVACSYWEHFKPISDDLIAAMKAELGEDFFDGE